MIRIGICGVGSMGRRHAACYRLLPGVRVTALAGGRRGVPEEMAREHRAEVYDSAADLIERADVDAVDICLPTDLHCETSLQAAKRGLHCLCEKPLALTLRECDRIIRAVENAGVVYMVAHVLRFWPEYRRLRETVEKGTHGPLRALTMHRVTGGTRKPGSWRADVARCGGAALDLHIHDVDFIRRLLGEPRRVDADGVRVNGAWDYIAGSFHYPGVAVNAIGAWNLPRKLPFDQGFRAVFDRAVMEYSSRHQPLTLYSECGRERRLKLRHHERAEAAMPHKRLSMTAFHAQAKYFVDCVRHQRPPAFATAADARESVAVVLREIRSAERKRRG